jgi:hypothetical protein
MGRAGGARPGEEKKRGVVNSSSSREPALELLASTPTCLETEKCVDTNFNVSLLWCPLPSRIVLSEFVPAPAAAAAFLST